MCIISLLGIDRRHSHRRHPFHTDANRPPNKRRGVNIPVIMLSRGDSASVAFLGRYVNSSPKHQFLDYGKTGPLYSHDLETFDSCLAMSGLIYVISRLHMFTHAQFTRCF